MLLFLKKKLIVTFKFCGMHLFYKQICSVLTAMLPSLCAFAIRFTPVPGIT